jgi:hypothetical protein
MIRMGVMGRGNRKMCISKLVICSLRVLCLVLSVV